jgi:DNA-binding response OmpR family regulator
MKKIIIAETIMRDLGSSNSLFTRSIITFSVAHSSEEMLNLHGVKKADLIIADDSLPLMGGAKLCSLIRSHDDLKSVSIILVCSDTEASLSECRSVGANAVIMKPVDPGILLWKASELLVVPQRKDIRVQLEVVIKGMEGTTPFFAESQNISISGLQIDTDRVLKENDQLVCTFNIAHNAITVACNVRRMETTASGKYRYGVKFINCDTKSLVIIEHYVKTQSKR